MSRQPDYNQNTAPYVLPNQPIFRFDNIDDTKFSILPREIDSGLKEIMVPFTNNGKLQPVYFQSSMIDLLKAGLEAGNSVGGRIDWIDAAIDTQYLVWAFADADREPVGFGISMVPKSTGQTIASGTKGSLATLTNLTNAYRFTIGARVRVIQVDGVAPYFIGEWNLGTVQSIDSDIQIKVLLDNDSVYGVNMVTNPGVSVEQLNRFTPYKPNSIAQELFQPYYQLIGLAETIDDGGPVFLRYFEWPIRKYNFYYQRPRIYSIATTGTYNFTCAIIKKYCPENIGIIHAGARIEQNPGHTSRPFTSCFITALPTLGFYMEADRGMLSGGGQYEQTWLSIKKDKTFTVDGDHANLSATHAVYIKGWEV